MAELPNLTVDVVVRDAVQRTVGLLRVAQEIIRKYATVDEQRAWAAAVDLWLRELEVRAVDAKGAAFTSKN